jgi:hypothetical protein
VRRDIWRKPAIVRLRLVAKMSLGEKKGTFIFSVKASWGVVHRWQGGLQPEPPLRLFHSPRRAERGMGGLGAEGVGAVQERAGGLIQREGRVMRHPQEKIKEAILHPDIEIRDRAVSLKRGSFYRLRADFSGTR